MKKKSTPRSPRKTGISHFEIREGGPKGFTLTYQYHGSTLTMSKDYRTREEAENQIQYLKGEN